MIKMKALRTFGYAGVNEGSIMRGREFSVNDEHRAKDLESHGLAYRVVVRPEIPIVNKMIVPSNEAAEAGPLSLAGGTTGGAEPVSSLLPDHQPRRRRSRRSEDADLLS